MKRAVVAGAAAIVLAISLAACGDTSAAINGCDHKQSSRALKNYCTCIVTQLEKLGVSGSTLDEMFGHGNLPDTEKYSQVVAAYKSPKVKACTRFTKQ